MKKIIAIVLIVAVCVGVFVMVKGGGNDLAKDFVTISDVKGVTFAVPAEIASVKANNEKFIDVYKRAQENKITNEDLRSAHLYKKDSQYAYLSSNNFVIIITPIDSPVSLESVYERADLALFVETFFGVTNVSSSARSMTNLKEVKVSCPVKATVPSYGMMMGHFTAIEKGFDTVGILVLATESYARTNGSDTAEEMTKAISKTFALSDEALVFPTSPDALVKNPEETQLENKI